MDPTDPDPQHRLRRTSWWCRIPEVTAAGLSALDDVTRQEVRKSALPLIMRASLVWLDSGPLRRNLGKKNKILYFPSYTVAYILHVYRYICNTIIDLLMIKMLSHCPVGHLLFFFILQELLIFM